MTKEELITELLNIVKLNHDPEMAHSKADLLLLKYIDDERVRKAYDEIEKWYA